MPTSLLVQQVEAGTIGLPDIQRPFVWTAAKARDLFDSMYRGFPVGYLLLWQTGNQTGVKTIGDLPGSGAPASLLIVDGQQRLTSLYAVMRGVTIVNADYSKGRIRVGFRPRDSTFQVADATIAKDPEYVPDISVLWAPDADMHGFIEGFLTRLGDSRELEAEDRKRIAAAITRVHQLQSYQFTTLQLSASVTEEQVAEVFVRINSKGVTLKQADFILTLMSVYWDEGRAALEDFCRAARVPSTNGASPFNHFLMPDPAELLRTAIVVGFRRGRLDAAYSLLRGKDLVTKQFSHEARDVQFARLKEAQGDVLNLTNWHEFLKVPLRAGYANGSLITSGVGLVYSYALYLIGLRDFQVGHTALRDVMARWLFLSQVTFRYSGAPETTIEADVARLEGLTTADEFIAALDAVVRDTFTPDFWDITLPNDLATSASRSASLSALYAAQTVLGSRALFSSLRVSDCLDPSVKAKKSAVERHHLFPKQHLATLGISNRRRTNQIANFALVEWGDNIAISAKSPADYWPVYAEKMASQPDAFAAMCRDHALPEDWIHMDYDEFLATRRKLMAGVIRRGAGQLGGPLASPASTA